ncbi:MAG TPA: VOC family protein [Acidimicrobiales bacterium]|jgi:catechol 2,3-dioxygenase-like lactoylglutathione lyase family enzyme|nr:VOC family protein [Acidimicrobiales bacterium]
MLGEEVLAMIKVTELDHLVLCCADVGRTLEWYQQRLGLPGVRVEEWRRGEAPFPSLRVTPDTIIDLVGGGVTGRNLEHLCVVVDPVDFEAVAASGEFEVLDGPAPRFGARGTGTSLYVRDPDGTTVELRYY